MPHPHLTTEAIVLRGFPRGEGHRDLLLLTRGLGLVRATARSAREGRSKLRAALADYSHAHITLVRGRDAYRVVGALPVGNFFFEVRDAHKRRLMARLTRLLLRLVKGEEKNEGLFSLFASGFSFLALEPLAVEDVRNLECLLVLRVLHALGYVGEREDFAGTILSPSLTRADIAAIAPLRTQVVRQINTSLSESHL